MKQVIAVLGLGNDLMSDEGIGVVLVRRMSQRSKDFPKVDFVDGGTGGLALLYQIEGRQKVVFIDCAYMGAEPGTLKRFTLEQVQSTKELPGHSLHEADLLNILRMAQQLGHCPDEVVILGIEPQTVAVGQELTETLQGSLDDYLHAVEQELQ